MTPQELRASILQQAIQGKLVGQRSEEGTGEELFQQIRAEKQNLIKAGKIKKGKPYPEISEEEIPFDIPDTWVMARLQDIVYNRGQEVPSETFCYIDIGSIDNKRQKLNAEDNIVEASKAPSRARKLVQLGDILYSTVRPYLHNMCIIDRDFSHKPIASTGFAAMTCFGGIYNKYLFYYLLSPIFDSYANDTENAKGVAYPAINDDRLYRAVIAIPPFAEQKRIVAKLEEILPLIDRYEVAWNKLEEFNKRFPGDMQKSILQLAMQGKLVRQDEAEYPQRELYRQVQQKYKRAKSLPAISEDEIPYEIPDSWFWVRLGNALIIERGGSPRPIKDYITNDPNGINWIKIGDTEKGGKYINSTQERIIPEGMKKSRYVQKGDFLLSNSMSFGRPYILNIDGCIHDGWLVLRPVLELFDKDYLYYLLSSPMVFAQFCSRVAGAVVNNLNSDKVALTVVPVPPIEEQKRIVAKLEEILPLCDRLK